MQDLEHDTLVERELEKLTLQSSEDDLATNIRCQSDITWMPKTNACIPQFRAIKSYDSPFIQHDSSKDVIVVTPTPYSSKTTQVNADEILMATGFRSELSMCRLQRRKQTHYDDQSGEYNQTRDARYSQSDDHKNTCNQSEYTKHSHGVQNSESHETRSSLFQHQGRRELLIPERETKASNRQRRVQIGGAIVIQNDIESNDLHVPQCPIVRQSTGDTNDSGIMEEQQECLINRYTFYIITETGSTIL